ncbi:MAG TPA: 3-isopropylmalate dehydrogenase [Oceanospirillales bacterium]|nr:3-isopropylmalate dehydrogenase [Oceanospirillales bacterium]
MKKIAILAGDGIGPEVMKQTLRVLDALNLAIETRHGLIGGAAYDKCSSHFPDSTKELCLSSDAVLFGSVGGPITQAHLPKWHRCEANSILALRKTLALNVNLRPATLFKSLLKISPLKPELIAQGVDIMIIRELLGDIYFGEHKQFSENGLRIATDIARYDENQIKIALHQGFKTAMSRNKKLVSVDKANVLDTSKLWRNITDEVAREYPQVTLEHMLVDNCAMQLILNPAQFDTIVTANLFGDILSDAASALPGSLGLMPSASFSASGFGLYEPSGGSAPEIANKNIVNPTAQILSLALMLRYSFNLQQQANQIEQAIIKTLEAGYRTADIYQDGDKKVGTVEFTDKVIFFLE